MWDYRAACQARNSRIGAEAPALWQVSLLGNPPVSDYAEMVVRDGQGQTFQVRVSDLTGRIVSQQRVSIGQPGQTIRAGLGPVGGLYLLEVSDGHRRQIMRVLRP